MSENGPPVNHAVYTIGWFCAFLMPIIGLVIGGLCIAQGPRREGTWMVAVSLLAGVAIVALSRNAATI